MSSCPTLFPASATEGLSILTHHYSLGTWVWHSCSYWNWLPKLQCLVPVILPSFSLVTHTSVSVLTFWVTHDIPLQKLSSWIQVPGGHIKSILRCCSSVTPDFNSFCYLPPTTTQHWHLYLRNTSVPSLLWFTLLIDYIPSDADFSKTGPSVQ